MKKLFLSAFIIVSCFINSHINKDRLDDLTLANIEALAQGESGNITTHCYKYISSSGSGLGNYIRYCGGCQLLYATSWNSESICL